MDPDLPVAGMRTMGDVFAAGASSRRFQTMLVQMFALTALLMVLAGLYAVTSYHVAGRTREIGIRIALGAERTEVVTAVVGRSLSLAALGASIGVGVALASSRVTAGLLYGVGRSLQVEDSAGGKARLGEVRQGLYLYVAFHPPGGADTAHRHVQRLGLVYGGRWLWPLGLRGLTGHGITSPPSLAHLQHGPGALP